MRLVVHTEEGTISINYTWLPTWIGMNNILLAEVGKIIHSEFKGKPLDEEHLDMMHMRASELLCEKLRIKGLSALFEALRAVES